MNQERTRYQIRLPLGLVILSTALGVGCGVQMSKDGSVSMPASEDSWSMETSEKSDSATKAEGEPTSFTNVARNLSVVDRKIIYTANFYLVVSDIEKLNDDINQLVQQYGGLVASNSIDSKQNRQRTGNWRVRIPTENFDAFYIGVKKLGDPITATRDSQDVTEEYLDVEARIKNKKALEERILKLLERPDDKIQHVIEVERELGRIRGEIERMEGRMRYLKDRIALTTITISAREELNYKPEEAATLSSRIGTSWTSSLTGLKNFGENSLVWLVGAVPWIVIWGFLLTLAWIVFRVWRRLRRKRQSVATA